MKVTHRYQYERWVKVLLMGARGSGKTTLIRRLIKTDDGEEENWDAVQQTTKPIELVPGPCNKPV